MIWRILIHNRIIVHSQNYEVQKNYNETLNLGSRLKLFYWSLKPEELPFLVGQIYTFPSRKFELDKNIWSLSPLLGA
ncbi:hypothetical protein AAES_166518 [Amazona aestiva]|uniref:Uncharacterized protein n=1 Tax=Amazona aestiva TaxID=12930 RepID=A0A0Q3UPQ7_AMAAE|nr:hypothetical protein AAES_166518 [Amazona aestiva]